MYADASLLVSAFSREANSEMARKWLAGLAPGELMTSRWCDTEIASALAMKARRRELTGPDLAVTRKAMRALFEDSATLIPIADHHCRTAGELIERSAKPLRGGDALHLAIARSRDAIVWTLDKDMAEAGEALGLGTRLLA